MSEKEDKVASDVRLTFRTFSTHVEKLELVARARNLTIGKRYSVGAAINYIIEHYNVASERDMLKVKMKRRKSNG